MQFFFWAKFTVLRLFYLKWSFFFSIFPNKVSILVLIEWIQITQGYMLLWLLEKSGSFFYSFLDFIISLTNFIKTTFMEDNMPFKEGLLHLNSIVFIKHSTTILLSQPLIHYICKPNYCNIRKILLANQKTKVTFDATPQQP